MKRILIFLMLLVLLAPPVFGAEEEYSDDFRNSVSPENPILSEGANITDPEELAKEISFKKMMHYLWGLIQNGLRPALKSLVTGLALVMLSVLVNRCSGNIQNQNLQMLFSFMISLSIALMVEQSLSQNAAGLQKSIENMGVFTAACIPSFSVVMIAAGEGAGAAVFSAVLVLVGELGALISNGLMMPLTDVYLAIGICSAVSDEYNFAAIAKNIRRFMLWAISLLAIIFRLVIKLQSTAAAAGDQVAKKYIKTAVGSLIPMVGNTLSQGVDSLFTAAAGVKVSFAVAGGLIVLSLILPALISAAMQGLVWSLCRWVAEFMNDSTIRSVASVLANSYYLMVALGGCVGMMGLFSFFGIMSVV